MERKEPARRRALELLERLKGGPGDKLSDEEAMAIALEAQRSVRRQISRQNMSRAKRSRE